ncbi:hypothetical protein PACTADRAFT_15126 [Pachysolen tannophilus NRRL Y-2460]|uniref:Uncharacterized protein n=1 Tax=Pachysolen tannophilus NRRL Y-2460 TaxID=669874 RepID=A0A1E4TXV0_PACTA|nr:hypothetical protein PACTADRAFT_15126 [Pachysolen tannophilus NRRL Y-2460]
MNSTSDSSSRNNGSGGSIQRLDSGFFQERAPASASASAQPQQHQAAAYNSNDGDDNNNGGDRNNITGDYYRETTPLNYNYAETLHQQLILNTLENQDHVLLHSILSNISTNEYKHQLKLKLCGKE